MTPMDNLAVMTLCATRRGYGAKKGPLPSATLGALRYGVVGQLAKWSWRLSWKARGSLRRIFVGSGNPKRGASRPWLSTESGAGQAYPCHLSQALKRGDEAFKMIFKFRSLAKGYDAVSILAGTELLLARLG